MLVVGVALGWALSNLRPAPLRAGAGDRSGESIVATGPVIVRYDEGAKAPIPLEAVYFLDYKTGRLLATIPTYQQSAASTRIIDPFVERDLASDFKLDLDIGPRPSLSDDHGLARPLHRGLGARCTSSRPPRANWASTGSSSSSRRRIRHGPGSSL